MPWWYYSFPFCSKYPKRRNVGTIYARKKQNLPNIWTSKKSLKKIKKGGWQEAVILVLYRGTQREASTKRELLKTTLGKAKKVWKKYLTNEEEWCIISFRAQAKSWVSDGPWKLNNDRRNPRFFWEVLKEKLLENSVNGFSGKTDMWKSYQYAKRKNELRALKWL